MPPHKCSYFMCNNSSDKKSMFRFPCDKPKRLAVWLNNCGNMTIAHLPPHALRSRYICIDHFKMKYIRSVGPHRTRLAPFAIPQHYQDPNSHDSSRSPSPSPEPNVETITDVRSTQLIPTEDTFNTIRTYSRFNSVYSGPGYIQTFVHTSDGLSENYDELQELPSTNENPSKDDVNIQPSEIDQTNKSPCPSASSNKQTDVPTSEVQSETDDHLPKVTEESKNAEDNNTRNSTEVIGDKIRKKKPIVYVKLAKVTSANENRPSKEVVNVQLSKIVRTNVVSKIRKKKPIVKLPALLSTNKYQIFKDDEYIQPSKITRTYKSPRNSVLSNKLTDVPTSEVQSETERRKKQMNDVKLPEAEELIASVYKFLQAEYEFLKSYIGDICDLSPLTNVLKRTADACGVCKFTVRHIVDKTRAQTDRGEVGPAKRAKLRRQDSSLAREDSSCDESGNEGEGAVEDEIQMDYDRSIKEESSSSDSDDELRGEDRLTDEDSEDQDECEVEAPCMDVDDEDTRSIDPLETEPVEVKKETTVKTETTDVSTLQNPVKTEPTEEISESISQENTQQLDPVKKDPAEDTESIPQENTQPLDPVKTEPTEEMTEPTHLENTEMGLIPRFLPWSPTQETIPW